jgi:predicted HAD superfamily Cof-like phosphohydrolase
MAILIVEGVDFSGKTTLVNKLQKDLNLFSLKSPRPHSPQDILTIASRTNQMAEGMDIICDRIALISEPIYGAVCRKHLPSLIEPQVADFMLESMQPIIIWCCPPWDHVKKCSNDQMEGVKENLQELYGAYRDSILRINDRMIVLAYDFTVTSYEDLLSEVAGYLDHQKQELPTDREMEAVEAFHNKFGVEMPLTLSLMNEETLEFRKKFLQEELDEFLEAHNAGDFITAFDSLLDLTYVAKGTALLMGIDATQWALGFDIVNNANMQKQRAQSASESKRGSALDVIKPPGWEVHKPEPKLKKLLGL